MTTALVSGLVTAIEANTPYAIPLGSYRILSTVALTYSTTVGGSYSALMFGETEPGALLTAGGFIQCGSAASVVLKKVGFKKTYAGVVGRSSPVSFWRFGEQSGNTLYDSSGVNNLAKGSTCVLGTAGPLGDSSFAITLDGTANGGASLTNAVEIPLNQTALSFEAWVYNAAWSATHEMVICLGAVGFYMSVQNGKPFMSIVIIGQGQKTTVAVSAISANAWHHIAATWASGDQQRIYVDGVEVAVVTNTTYTGTLETSPNIYIGSFAAGSLFYSGIIANPAIYTRELQAAEISAHYGARLVP